MASLTDTARYRWRVASRVLAAVVGGYALTSAVTVLLALLWPLPKAEAVLASSMLSFALYAGVLVWIFAARRLRVVWLGLILATAVCAGLSWLLLPGGGA
ncbi:iron transporter [Pseudomonas sp. MYb185]|uniref:iron transporter n=1 Tax=Pseudomonas sp. MYb185 TaxID=1848729 RepID=UPI000CFB5964|nr:iron transporter [Pseudomonas sp. MYb185]PRB84682.1 iron transporter [Pseudomonas sp. MYb185]